MRARARVDVDVPVDDDARARRRGEHWRFVIECTSMNDVARAGVCG